MTAKDSKSTPKKAEDQPRHPLALLARKWEHAANFEAINIEEVCAFRRCTRELRDLMTQMESQESALRAQAEAEAGLRHLLRRAHAFVGGIREVRRESGNFAREFRWRTPTSTEKLHDELTAALAQAGGEG